MLRREEEDNFKMSRKEKDEDSSLATKVNTTATTVMTTKSSWWPSVFQFGSTYVWTPTGLQIGSVALLVSGFVYGWKRPASMIKEEGLQKVAVALASQEGKPRTFTWWEKQLRLHEPARISVVAGRALLGATVLSCGVFASGMLGLMYAMDVQSMDDFSYKTKTSFAKMRKKTLSVLGVKMKEITAEDLQQEAEELAYLEKIFIDAASENPHNVPEFTK